MKTIDLAAGSPSLAEVLRLAAEEDVILRLADGTEFVLAELDDFDREVSLARQKPELMELLERRSRPNSTVSLDQARKELGLDP